MQSRRKSLSEREVATIPLHRTSVASSLGSNSISKYQEKLILFTQHDPL